MPTSFDEEDEPSNTTSPAPQEKSSKGTKKERKIEADRAALEKYFSLLKSPPKHERTTIHHLFDNRFRVNQFVKKPNGDIVVGKSYYCKVLTGDVVCDPPTSI